MSFKLNVGASKKVGESNFGSRGASVNLEFELDAAAVADPEKLRAKVRSLFIIVRSSLAEELHSGNGHAQPSAPSNGNGESRARGGDDGRASNPRPATSSQVKALHAIARSRGVDLTDFLFRLFHVGRADNLTIKQASVAIDELKSSPPS